jgi:ribosomal protein S18 acetylase RimI-like enzyme
MLMPAAQRGDGQWDDGSLRIVLQQGRPADWELFRREHYKQGPLHKGAACFLARLPAFGGEVVGFVAALQHPGALGPRHYREHRVCVLEKWQGIGIGSAITGAQGHAGSEGKQMQHPPCHLCHSQPPYPPANPPFSSSLFSAMQAAAAGIRVRVCMCA